MRLAQRLLAALLLPLLFGACNGGDGEPAPSPSPGPALAAGEVRITYYGHSMFTIESPGGVMVLTDPNEGLGYRAPPGPVDVITVSHDHFDHNKTEVAGGAPVLRGLEDGEWALVDETMDDVRISTVGTFHDASGGRDRGLNAMFVLETAGLRIIHAGDLGHGLFDDDELREIRPLDADIILLPVGGHFTIGPQEAARVIEEAGARLAIPMHYRTEALRDFPDRERLGPVDDFLAGRTDVTRPGQSSIVLRAGELPSGVLVLEPQPE